jgi:hypothetical protein
MDSVERHPGFAVNAACEANDGQSEPLDRLPPETTQRENPESLREQAAHCRRLASSISDTRTVAALKELAVEYDGQAARLKQAN